MSSHRASVSGNVLKIAGYKHQADATLAQAAPVQNTYYTVLDTTKNVRIISIGAKIATTGEDLNLRLTVDGQSIISVTVSCAADTNYRLIFRQSFLGTPELTADPINVQGFVFEGRTVKVEIRKTTVAGVGTLSARVMYAKIP